MSLRTISIIIPSYNEEERIDRVLQSVLTSDTLGYKKEIVVIDDGSDDNTKQKIQNLKLRLKKKDSIKLIYKKKNEGKGAALKSGFEIATGDILLIQDADEEYSVMDYPQLIKPFITRSEDIVYGSRNLKRQVFHNTYSHILFYFGGLFLTWFVNILFNLKLTDQPTGYKIFSKSIKKLLLQPSENGFSYEVAVTAICAKNNIRFIEIPIHYKPRTVKEGKKINIWDFIESIFVALKYKLTYSN